MTTTQKASSLSQERYNELRVGAAEAASKAVFEYLDAQPDITNKSYIGLSADGVNLAYCVIATSIINDVDIVAEGARRVAKEVIGLQGEGGVQSLIDVSQFKSGGTH